MTYKTQVVAFTINMLNTCTIYLVLFKKKMGQILFAIATILQRKGGKIFDNSKTVTTGI